MGNSFGGDDGRLEPFDTEWTRGESDVPFG
jgi:hypothetical protein